MNFIEILAQATRQWREEAERWRRGAMGSAPLDSTMLQLIRPNLGGASASPTVRRYLEPLVAASAVLALLVLGGLGIISFALFLLAGALIYAILTKVFGLELGIEMPTPNL